MSVVVQREPSNSICTMGTMYIDGAQECFTLEPPAGPMLIPAGTYPAKKTFSPRLRYICPELLDVPGHTDERIHIGNEAQDTLGCTLVGQIYKENFIGNSRDAFYALMAKLPDEFEVTYVDAPA